VINLNLLESLYRDFFKSSISSMTQGERLIEVKNRCFKDLYNIIEESIVKFYELYVDSMATKQKNI
jgi:hypothetical protein